MRATGNGAVPRSYPVGGLCVRGAERVSFLSFSGQFPIRYVSRCILRKCIQCVSRCIPYVSDMYHECILCVMYLKYKKFQITIPAPSAFMQTRQIPKFQITIPAPSAFMQTRQIPKFQITIPAPSALQTRQIPRFQITIPAPSAFMQTRDLLGKSPDFKLQIPVLRPARSTRLGFRNPEG